MTVSPGVVDAVLLVALSAVTAQPIPRMLARARWPHRAPRTALVAWVVTGTAMWGSAVAALLALGTAPQGGHLLSNLAGCLRDCADGRTPLPLYGSALCGGAAGIVCWQVTQVVACSVRLARCRREHRALLDLVGTVDPDLGVVVLDDPRPFAYHLPGLYDHRLVITRGCLDLADSDEMQAVLAHERAHVRGRHQVMIQIGLAWQRSYPFLAGPRMSASVVGLLTEMLADDAAARHVGPRATLAAIHRVGCGLAGAELYEPWHPDSATLQRARRLLTSEPRVMTAVS